MADAPNRVQSIEADLGTLQSSLTKRDAVAANQAHQALISDLRAETSPEQAYLQIRKDTKGDADIAFLANPDRLELGGLTEHKYEELMDSHDKEFVLADLSKRWTDQGQPSVEEAVKTDVAMWSDTTYGFLSNKTREGFDQRLRDAFEEGGGRGLDAYFNAVSEQINKPDSPFVLERTGLTPLIPGDPDLQPGAYGKYQVRYRKNQLTSEFKF